MPDTKGFREGDRVSIASLWRIRPTAGHPGVVATGHIREFNDLGAIVDFDNGPIHGIDYCLAAISELTRIEPFDA